MLQRERLAQVDELVGQVYEEMKDGYIDNSELEILDHAVNIQININRIVFKMNEVCFGRKE